MLAVAGKDLLRLIRSPSFLTFGFLIPLLMAGIFYLAFGGIGSTGETFSVAPTRVLVVNQDAPPSAAAGFSAGRLLVDVLSSAELSSLLDVSVVADPAAARQAVDRQEAGVAVVVPAGLTGAAIEPGSRSTIEVYSDPTLTLGPGIVRSVIESFADYYAGSAIAQGVAADQLGLRGAGLSPDEAGALAQQYAAWAYGLGAGRQESSPLLDMRAPGEAGTPAADLRLAIVSSIMAGMMAFYVFFSGASSAETLLAEEEGGTLARILTTPTPVRDVLGGRLIATYAMLAVQVAVLLVSSWLIFGIHWGQPAPIAAVALGMIVLAASFGLFVTSLLRSTKQGGLVYGGLMTILGMTGMIGIFAMSSADAPRAAMDTASLFTPQGWAVRGWLRLLDGAQLLDVLPTVAVMIALSVAFFAVGLLRFRRRFA